MPDLIQILSEASGPRGNKLILTKIRVELSPPLLPWQPPNLQKSSSLNTVDGFQSFFYSKVPHVTVYQINGNYDDIHKKIATRGKGPISLYDLFRKS